jgi:hypothetical protein
LPRKSLFTALACMPIVAPAFAEPVAFPFAPEKGAVWTITEARTRTTNQADKPPLTEVTTTGRLTVVEETDEGYLMEWVVESLSVDGMTITAEDGFTQLIIGLPIRFEADGAGSPVEIHQAESLVDSVMAAVSAATTSSDPQVMALTRQIMSAPEMLVNSLLPQAALIGSCQRFELEPGEKQEFDTVSPNVLGGPPIPATTTVVLEDKGSETTPALIRIVEAYDPKAAAAAIMESLRLITAQRNLPPPGPEEKMPPLTRVADIACHVDARTGEAVKVVMDMKVDAGESLRRQDVRDIVIKRRN